MPSNPTSLNILCWSGYEAPEFVREFEQRSDCIVRGEAFDSDMQAADRITNEPDWDLININNPYVSDYLYPGGKIAVLDKLGFQDEIDRALPCLDGFLQCGYSRDGASLIGLCQRFGPFNMVIDQLQVTPSTARNEGFALANDPANKGKFGVLIYPEFNVMHASIACGINPFDVLSNKEEARVIDQLQQWKDDALICTSDHHELNRALIDGRIRFYISGGVYTAGTARGEGHRNIISITPNSGPINGKGGIAFVEVTSICKNSDNPELATQYLNYMMEPEQCHRIAFANGIHNPVAQMGDPRVMAKFTAEDLKTIQFSTLDSDMAKCVPYSTIPNFRAIHSAYGLVSD